MSAPAPAHHPLRAIQAPKLHALYEVFPQPHYVPASALSTKRPAAAGPDPDDEALQLAGGSTTTEEAAGLLRVPVQRLTDKNGQLRPRIDHRALPGRVLLWSLSDIRALIAEREASEQATALLGEVITSGQAARLLGVSVEALNHCKSRYRRTIRHQKNAGGRLVWAVADIHALIAAEVQ